MNEEETYMGEWPVKPYYKRDLAMGYAPDITPVAALNRLSAWIHHHKPLYQALLDSGYADRQRIFNSVQVGLISIIWEDRRSRASVCLVLHVSMCRPMHTYVSPHTDVYVRRRRRMD